MLALLGLAPHYCRRVYYYHSFTTAALPYRGVFTFTRINGVIESRCYLFINLLPLGWYGVPGCPPDQVDDSLQSDFLGWARFGGILGGLRKIPHPVAIYWVRI